MATPRGHLEVQRHARPAIVLIDRDVVLLAHQGFGERDGQHAVSQVEPLTVRLQVERYVGFR
jgi:hypothetical protein